MMNDNYLLIRAAKLVSASTISGWRKEGRHPSWVDAFYAKQRALDEALRIIVEQKATIRTLAGMVDR